MLNRSVDIIFVATDQIADINIFDFIRHTGPQNTTFSIPPSLPPPNNISLDATGEREEAHCETFFASRKIAF